MIRETLYNFRDLKKGWMAMLSTIEEAYEQATATGSTAPKLASVVSSPSDVARFEYYILEKVSLEEMLEAELQHFENAKADALGLISYVSDLQYRAIMTDFFINGESNRTIAERYHYEVRTIKKIKVRCIQEIERALQGTPLG